jgi:hypothetical protein
LELVNRAETLALIGGLAVASTACSRRPGPNADELRTTVVEIDTAGTAARTNGSARLPLSAQGRCLNAEQSWHYTVVFAAPAARVEAIFAGWRKPGPLRTKVERNPFTRHEITFQTTEPADGEAGPAAQEWDLRPSDIPAGAGYDGYVEAKIPPEIRALPHRHMKRPDFELLEDALVGTPRLQEVLYPPSGCATSLPLYSLSDAVVAELRGTNEDDAKLAARLANWSARMEKEIAYLLANLRPLLSASSSDGIYVLPV